MEQTRSNEVFILEVFIYLIWKDSVIQKRVPVHWLPRTWGELALSFLGRVRGQLSIHHGAVRVDPEHSEQRRRPVRS